MDVHALPAETLRRIPFKVHYDIFLRCVYNVSIVPHPFSDRGQVGVFTDLQQYVNSRLGNKPWYGCAPNMIDPDDRITKNGLQEIGFSQIAILPRWIMMFQLYRKHLRKLLFWYT